MFLVDEWAERHINAALKRGELNNLSGEGKPLFWMTILMFPLNCVLATGF